jgi:hypothetical protein
MHLAAADAVNHAAEFRGICPRAYMTEFFSKIIEFVKLPLKYIWAVLLVSSGLIFFPEKWKYKICVDKFSEEHTSLIGIIFLFSAAIVLINILLWFWGLIQSRVNKAKFTSSAIKALVRLDPKEKAVLREFYIQDQDTLLLPIDNPFVAGLMQKGIIQQVGSLGESSLAGMLFSVTIYPPIKEFVTPEILDLPVHEPTEAEIERIKDSRPDFLFEIEEHKRVFHTSWRRSI